MNILLINPPIRLNALPYFHPIGLGIVANVLKNAGHTVQILDLNMIRCEEEDIAKHLPSDTFGLIGVSGIITTFGYLKTLIPELRKKYDAPIVIGGGGYTSAPEVYQQAFQPDYGVIGEGEYTLLELVRQLETGNPKDVLGLYGNPPRPLEPNLNNFPLPAFDLLPTNEYARVVKYAQKGKRELAFLSTRGCPWSCNYCYHIFGRGVRYRSVEHILSEMEVLRRDYMVDALLMADECLTVHKRIVQKLCREMIQRQYNFEWICYSRVDTVDEETLKLMAQAGCKMIGFGFESGSQRMLDAMNKRVILDKMMNALTLARRYIPHVGTTFIFGYPGENDETVKETVDFCYKAGINQKAFFLQPYPGTRVFEENKGKILAKFGTLDNFFCALGDAGEFTINLTDWGEDEMQHKWFQAMAQIGFQKTLGYQLNV